MDIQNVFGRELQKCFKNTTLPNRVGIAVSGGVDSMFLAYSMQKYRDSSFEGLDIRALTIDHKYREGSSEEAVRVGNILRSWGINHTILELSYDGYNIHDATNFEKVARKMRYEMFLKFCKSHKIQHMLVAHNLDDQFETYLQRYQQNSTLYGLPGLKSSSSFPLTPVTREEEALNLKLVRPLLSFSKRDIIDNSISNGIPWFEDYTNKDIYLTKRNRIRHIIQEVIPQKQKYSLTGHRNGSSFACLSRENLLSTYRQILQYNDLVNQQVFALSRTIFPNAKLDKRTLSLSLEIRESLFEEFSIAVWSRFFYYSVEQISSVKHFYWYYAKLERSLVPKIYERLNKHNTILDQFSFTMLNLKWCFKRDASRNVVTLNIIRQAIISTDIQKISKQMKLHKLWSDWFLFDNRFWLRLKSTHKCSVYIEPFNSNNARHMQVSKDLLDEGTDLPFKSLEGIPLISTAEESCWKYALPTLGINTIGSIQYEWDVKQKQQIGICSTWKAHHG